MQVILKSVGVTGTDANSPIYMERNTNTDCSILWRDHTYKQNLISALYRLTEKTDDVKAIIEDIMEHQPSTPKKAIEEFVQKYAMHKGYEPYDLRCNYCEKQQFTDVVTSITMALSY